MIFDNIGANVPGRINNYLSIRKIRNDSIYKAIEITETDAVTALDFAKKIVDKIKDIKA